MEEELHERIKYAEMKARHKTKLRPWYKKWWGVLILIISSLFVITVIASGIYVYRTAKNINAQKEALFSGKNPELARQIVEGQNRPYLGNPEAKIIFVEFSDFACPVCKQNLPALKNIAKKHAKEIKIIFRNLLAHENSQDLAMAAACAGEQTKDGQSLFWPMHDLLFAKQGLVQKAGLTDLAISLGAERNQFEKCMNEQKYLAILQTDSATAALLDMTGTPTWYINNYKVDGLMSELEMEQVIQELLKTETPDNAVDDNVFTASSSNTKTITK